MMLHVQGGNVSNYLQRMGILSRSQQLGGGAAICPEPQYPASRLVRFQANVINQQYLGNVGATAQQCEI